MILNWIKFTSDNTINNQYHWWFSKFIIILWIHWHTSNIEYLINCLIIGWKATLSVKTKSKKKKFRESLSVLGLSWTVAFDYLQRISKLLVTSRRRSDAHGSPKRSAGEASKPRKDVNKGALWDSKYTWNVADDEVSAPPPPPLHHHQQPLHHRKSTACKSTKSTHIHPIVHRLWMMEIYLNYNIE